MHMNLDYQHHMQEYDLLEHILKISYDMDFGSSGSIRNNETNKELRNSKNNDSRCSWPSKLELAPLRLPRVTFSRKIVSRVQTPYNSKDKKVSFLIFEFYE